MVFHDVKTIALSPSLLPLTRDSLSYFVSFPDESTIRVVVSPSSTISDVVERLAFQFSDRPLLEECQLLRGGFPLPKSARMCSLPTKGHLLCFVMAYEDPQRLTENMVDAIIDHALTTKSGSPRKDPVLGDGNVYIQKRGLGSLPIPHVVDRADSYFSASDSPIGVRYKAESGFSVVSGGLISTVVDSRPFPVTVHLISSGSRELRRVSVRKSDPVAVLRDELFPSPETSMFFRLFCDDFPILNESASFSALLISSENVLEFRVDVASEVNAPPPELYVGSVTGRRGSHRKSFSFASAPIDLSMDSHRLIRGESTARRVLGETEPSLRRVGAVIRGEAVDPFAATEDNFRREAFARARRLDQLSVMARDAVSAAKQSRLDQTALHFANIENDRAVGHSFSPEPEMSQRWRPQEEVSRRVDSFVPESLPVVRSPPRTRSASPPTTRSRAVPSSRPPQDVHSGAMTNAQTVRYSVSTVGDAASVGPIVKPYDPSSQVPIVFVDPDDPSHLHQLNVYGSNLVCQLRKYSSSQEGGVDVMCDGSVVVPRRARSSSLTFWDVTRGLPGKVFSLRNL